MSVNLKRARRSLARTVAADSSKTAHVSLRLKPCASCVTNTSQFSRASDSNALTSASRISGRSSAVEEISRHFLKSLRAFSSESDSKSVRESVRNLRQFRFLIRVATPDVRGRVLVVRQAAPSRRTRTPASRTVCRPFPRRGQVGVYLPSELADVGLAWCALAVVSRVSERATIS